MHTSEMVEQPEEPFCQMSATNMRVEEEEEEEEEEDVSYHRPPAIKRTKPMPTIAATASIPGE